MIDEKLLTEVWEDLENSDKPILKTGFEDIDTIMGLTDGKGALVTIGARPAMGKTTFALSVLENILKQNKKVLIFSLEMSDVQIVKKILLMSAEIDAQKAKLGELGASDFIKLAEKLEIINGWDLSVDDTPCITVEQIEEKIKEVKPEIVFIDYLQLISGNKKKDRYSQVEDICVNLKRITKENSVIIFVTSQLSRAVESRCDKRPLLSDLRESGAIENVSDVVIFLYRDEYYYSCDEDVLRKKGETEVIVAKNKFGYCGTAHLLLRASVPKFYPELRSEHFDVF